METSPDALANVTGDPSVVVRAVKDITFGSIAGMVSKVFEHPFDLTKVRLQAQVLDDTARFDGPLDCLKTTWRKEGVTGLFRGLPAPIVGSMAENASLFLAYSEIQNLIRYASSRPLSEPLSISQLALAGAGAGAITSFILTPIELIKCKMQVQMLAVPPHLAHTLPGPVKVFTSVIRNTGFRGLWLGHTGTFIREAGGSGAWFAVKEFVAAQLVKRRLGPRAVVTEGDSGKKSKPQLLIWESALSGACAGAAFNLALFPADSVKSAMQTEEELRASRSPSTEPASSSTKPSFGGTARAMYRAQGIRGLYAGCGITILKSIPSSAIIFIIYDGLVRRFG